MGLGVWIEKQWGRKGSMQHIAQSSKNALVFFVHIDGWHGPTAEELVTRGKGIGVLS